MAFKTPIKKKESRNLVHSKGRKIQYSDLLMAEYLSPSDVDISIDEKKWLFKVRTEDIDLKSNRRWMKEHIFQNMMIYTVKILKIWFTLAEY